MLEVEDNGLIAALASYQDNVEKRIQRAVDKVMPTVKREFIELLKLRVKQIFDESVYDFYSDYTPRYYHRNESLYNLLEMESDDNMLSAWFEPSKMTGFRSGYKGEDGLYDQVFRKGWHGGAGSGDYTTMNHTRKKTITTIGKDGASSRDISFTNQAVYYEPHPNPGTPYWRTPIDIYSRWGSPAAIAAEPPLAEFNRKLLEYETAEDGVIADYQYVWEKHMNDIQNYL